MIDKRNKFIEKSKKIHGNKYDYSLVNYEHSKIKVNIVCKDHGIFNQYIHNHLKGRGCPDCGNRLNSEEYILELFHNKHKDLYNYSKVDYINMNTKVEIICNTHGSFFQNPKDHIHRGHGCPKCGYKSGKLLSKEDVVRKSKEIFYDFFKYDKLVYSSSKKFIITCKIHGDFETDLRNHIHNKTGCPYCKIKSKGEFILYNFLKEQNINFKYQHRFKDCINYKTGRTLIFDFYLPSINAVIEYHGKQHYQEEPFFSGYGGFEGLKERDKIKYDYCLNKKIKFIEINKNNINELQTIIGFYT